MIAKGEDFDEDTAKRLFGGDEDKPIAAAIEEIKNGKILFKPRTAKL